MVGDMGCVCPLPKGKVPCVGVAFTSHFETPKGVSVWLATFVRCRWHHSFDIGHSIIIPFDNVLLLLGITNAHA